MRRLALLLPLLAATPARASDAIARFSDVPELDGTFEADFKSKIEPMTMTSHYTASGKIHVTLVSPGEWRGTAEAEVTCHVDLTTPGGTVVTSARGHATGKVRVHLIENKDSYQVDITLPDVAGRTTGTVSGQRIDHPASCGYPHTAPTAKLPDGGMKLAGHDTISAGANDANTVAWTLEGTPGDLVAIPKVAAVVRGEKSHLDGTASRKRERIQTWTWELAPGADCPEGVPPKTTLEGEEQDVLLLCSMDVTLTVSDGSKSSEPSKTVAAVRKRDWHTRVDAPIGPYKRLSEGLVSNNLHFGDTVCALEDAEADSVGHVIHRKASGADWEGSAFELEQVSDPKSPFDGWYWVGKNESVYARRIRINRELYPGSDTAQHNTDTAHAAALAKVLACTVKHEQEHERRIAQQVKGSADPARKMEPFAAQDESVLKEKVNREFRCFESRIAESNFFEQAVHAALQAGDCRAAATFKVEQPDGKFESYPVAHVADLGEGAVPPPAEHSDGCD